MSDRQFTVTSTSYSVCVMILKRSFELNLSDCLQKAAVNRIGIVLCQESVGGGLTDIQIRLSILWPGSKRKK